MPRNHRLFEDNISIYNTIPPSKPIIFPKKEPMNTGAISANNPLADQHYPLKSEPIAIPGKTPTVTHESLQYVGSPDRCYKKYKAI